MKKTRNQTDFFEKDPKKLLRLILDSIPATVFLKDRNSIYLGCNKQFADDAGLESVSDVVGKSDYDLAWKKEESDFFVETDQRVMENDTPELGIIEPILKADGKQYWLETNKVPLRDENDEVIGVFGTYKDITGRVHANEELKEYTKDLEFKNAELEQFAFIASHDLQEPLKTMTTLLEFFEENQEHALSEENGTILTKLKESSARMQELVTGLLQYARLGHDMQMEQLDSNGIIEEILLDLNDLIVDTTAVIDVRPLPSIYGSKPEIRSLFQNLISNSIKFREPGVAPAITIRSEAVGNANCFVVTDNGIGISETYREKVFMMYQRLNKRSEYGGTGIGLAHCKKIVELHKGEIWFEPLPDNLGTQFKFILPAHDNTN